MERKKRVGKDNNMKSNAEERGSGGKREEDKHEKRELEIYRAREGRVIEEVLTIILVEVLEVF